MWRWTLHRVVFICGRTDKSGLFAWIGETLDECRFVMGNLVRDHSVSHREIPAPRLGNKEHINLNVRFYVIFRKKVSNILLLIPKHWININNFIQCVLLEYCKIFSYSIIDFSLGYVSRDHITYSCWFTKLNQQNKFWEELISSFLLTRHRRIKNDGSSNYSLPQESVYQAVA
jgi:hypothetical protein